MIDTLSLRNIVLDAVRLLTEESHRWRIEVKEWRGVIREAVDAYANRVRTADPNAPDAPESDNTFGR